MNIREWLILYIKHKDLVKRSLVSIGENGDHITFSFKDGPVIGYAMETLTVPRDVTGKSIIACLHTPSNVDVLVKRWKEFASHPDLTVILANPVRNEKVIIHTRTHDSVSDGDVGNGIRSMAGEVPYV